MPGLHSRRDSTRQDENNSVNGTFIYHPHSQPILVSSRNSWRHVGKLVPSQKKRECLDCLASLLMILARECECLHSCVLRFYSHLAQSLDEYLRQECKSGIKVPVKVGNLLQIWETFT